MAGYAIANMKELENSAEQFGLAPDVEARFGRKALGARQSGLSYQRLAPSFRQPFGHSHAAQEEMYVVVSGGGRMKLGDEVIEVQQWDAIRVAPRTKRAFEAGPDGIEFLAFGAGESGDAEVVEGFWPSDVS
jgi:uncharacterized cupin superfamily protein